MRNYCIARFNKVEGREIEQGSRVEDYAHLISAAAKAIAPRSQILGINITALNESKGGRKLRIFIAFADRRCAVLSGNTRYVAAKAAEYDVLVGCGEYDRVVEIDDPVGYIGRYLDRVKSSGDSVFQMTALASSVIAAMGSRPVDESDARDIVVGAWNPDTAVPAAQAAQVANRGLVGEGW